MYRFSYTFIKNPFFSIISWIFIETSHQIIENKAVIKYITFHENPIKPSVVRENETAGKFKHLLSNRLRHILTPFLRSSQYSTSAINLWRTNRESLCIKRGY